MTAHTPGEWAALILFAIALLAGIAASIGAGRG